MECPSPRARCNVLRKKVERSKRTKRIKGIVIAHSRMLTRVGRSSADHNGSRERRGRAAIGRRDRGGSLGCRRLKHATRSRGIKSPACSSAALPLTLPSRRCPSPPPSSVPTRYTLLHSPRLQDNLPNCILPNAHSPNVNLSNAFCRHVFLPTCQKGELLKVEMQFADMPFCRRAKSRNVNSPKC